MRGRVATVVCAAVLTALTLLGLRAAFATEMPRVHTVVVEGMKFTPATVQLRPGDKVVFKNNDLVPHTATSKGAAVFDSGPIQPGTSWTLSPPAGQTLRYTCTYHPMMEGVIVTGKP